MLSYFNNNSKQIPFQYRHRSNKHLKFNTTIEVVQMLILLYIQSHPKKPVIVEFFINLSNCKPGNLWVFRSQIA